MRRESHTPSHSLDAAKRLASGGRLTINGRVRRFIQNHVGRFDIEKYLAGLFAAIETGHFEKSVELDAIPGCWGDVYRNVPYDGNEWYVKFALNDDGHVELCVLSSNWEGYIH